MFIIVPAALLVNKLAISSNPAETIDILKDSDSVVLTFLAEKTLTWSADRPSLRLRASMLDLIFSGALGKETEAPLPCLTLIWLSLGL